jgi:Leucine-rich repeat (LRR) protein
LTCQKDSKERIAGMGRYPEKNDKGDDAPRAPTRRDPTAAPTAFHASSTLDTFELRDKAASLVIERDADEQDARQQQMAVSSSDIAGANTTTAAKAASYVIQRDLEEQGEETMLEGKQSAALTMSSMSSGVSNIWTSRTLSSPVTRQQPNADPDIEAKSSQATTLALQRQARELQKANDGIEKPSSLQAGVTTQIAMFPPSLASEQRLQPTPGAQRVSVTGNDLESVASLGTFGGNTTVASEKATENLIQAEIVPRATVEMTGPIIVAKLMDETSTMSGTHQNYGFKFMGTRMKVFLVILILSVIGLIVGVVVGFTLKSSSGIAAAPTSSPTQVLSNVEFFTTVRLPEILSASSKDALSNPNSPQAKAMRWIESIPLHEDLSEGRLIQRFALACIYFSTGGENWSENDSWLSDADECSWFSTSDHTICSEEGFYIHLELEETGLHDQLPQELSFLSSLQTFNVARNDLWGTFPRGLQASTHLVELTLKENTFSGFVPPWIGNHSQLENIDISFNNMVGDFDWIGGLTSLRAFDCSNNTFSTTLPTALGNLAQLESFNCSGNILRGPLPSEIGLVQTLATLDLSFNNIQRIPDRITNLRNLRVLELQHNGLTGDIPAQLGRMTSLEHLSLSENYMQAHIPSNIGLMTKLTYLGFELTGVWGRLPTELGLLKKLRALYGGNNLMGGPVPSEIYGLISLEVLSLGTNFLSGSISSQIASLVNLEALSLYENSLTGSIPTVVGSLTHLRWLELDNNLLTGSIPTEIGSLTNLTLLSLFNNSYVEVPSEVCVLTTNYSLSPVDVHLDCDTNCSCCKGTWGCSFLV